MSKTPEASRGPTASAKSANILIHAINFHPELIGCGRYTSALAFHLARNGHAVEVVTAPPHYPGWSVARPYRAWRYARETVARVRVLRCPIATGSGGGLSRMIAPLSFAATAAPAVFWRILRGRPDVVLCVEPTLFCAPAALLAAKLVGARTVLQIQDLEVDAAFEVGHLKGARVRAFANALERALLRRFDLLVTISSQMRRTLINKGASEARTVVVRNGVDLDAIHPLPRDAANRFRAALGLRQDAVVALYSGHMGKKQALDVVLEAARLCLEEPRLHFVIAGEGPVKARLVETYGALANVSFLPLQPSEHLNELLNMADLHLLPQTRSAADLVLPSKLGGMLASGRPVIATVDPQTELGRLLKDSAIVAPPENPTALASCLASAIKQDLRALTERGRALAGELSESAILSRFERLLIDPLTLREGAIDPLSKLVSES